MNHWYSPRGEPTVCALFVMEDSGFTERLESLWFFSNVLSLTNQSMATDTVEKFPESSLNHSPKPESTKAFTTVPRNQKIETDNAEVVVQLQRCPDCVELGAETEIQVEKTEVFEVLQQPVKDENRRRRRSKRRAVWESDLEVKMGFSVNVVSGNRVVEEASGHHSHVKMPPLSDGIAMKQHLKYWAYAVACTVK